MSTRCWPSSRPTSGCTSCRRNGSAFACSSPTRCRPSTARAMSIDWAIIELAIPLLLHGLWTTLRICLLAILLGSVLGFALGLAVFSRFAPMRLAVRAYVDFVRGTPLLIQIFLVYFALPGIGINLNEFWAGVTALSLNAG